MTNERKGSRLVYDSAYEAHSKLTPEELTPKYTHNGLKRFVETPENEELPQELLDIMDGFLAPQSRTK